MTAEQNGQPDLDREELKCILQRAMAGALRETGLITGEQYRRVMLELGKRFTEAEHVR